MSKQRKSKSNQQNSRWPQKNIPNLLHFNVRELKNLFERYQKDQENKSQEESDAESIEDNNKIPQKNQTKIIMTNQVQKEIEQLENSIFCEALDVKLSEYDFQELNVNYSLTPNMVSFLLNFLENINMQLGQNKKDIFYDLLEIGRDSDAQLLHGYYSKEFDQLIQQEKQFDTKVQRYTIFLVYNIDRWVLHITIPNLEFMMIKDFKIEKFQEESVINMIIPKLLEIFEKQYQINLLHYEQLLLSPDQYAKPFQGDCGIQIIHFLYNLIKGIDIEKIEIDKWFDVKEIQDIYLWLLLKIKYNELEDLADTFTETWKPTVQNQQTKTISKETKTQIIQTTEVVVLDNVFYQGVINTKNYVEGLREQTFNSKRELNHEIENLKILNKEAIFYQTQFQQNKKNTQEILDKTRQFQKQINYTKEFKWDDYQKLQKQLKEVQRQNDQILSQYAYIIGVQVIKFKNIYQSYFNKSALKRLLQIDIKNVLWSDIIQIVDNEKKVINQDLMDHIIKLVQKNEKNKVKLIPNQGQRVERILFSESYDIQPQNNYNKNKKYINQSTPAEQYQQEYQNQNQNQQTQFNIAKTNLYSQNRYKLTPHSLYTQNFQPKINYNLQRNNSYHFLKNQNDDPVVSDKFGFIIKKSDQNSLEIQNILSENFMNCYLKLLQHIFDCYTDKKIQIFTTEIFQKISQNKQNIIYLKEVFINANQFRGLSFVIFPYYKQQQQEYTLFVLKMKQKEMVQYILNNIIKNDENQIRKSHEIDPIFLDLKIMIEQLMNQSWKIQINQQEQFNTYEKIANPSSLLLVSILKQEVFELPKKLIMDLLQIKREILKAIVYS